MLLALRHPTGVRIARRFLAPSATCFMVRFAADGHVMRSEPATHAPEAVSAILSYGSRACNSRSACPEARQRRAHSHAFGIAVGHAPPVTGKAAQCGSWRHSDGLRASAAALRFGVSGRLIGEGRHPTAMAR